MNNPFQKRRIKLWLILGISILGLFGIFQGPTITKQGVDFKVSSIEIPRYVKAIAFLHRHLEYKLLAKRITGGLNSEDEKVRAVFNWTVKNIRPTPKGWPIVDDHILNIIIRGYGVQDQMADVFTTLSTYAGIPAFWRAIKSNFKDGRIVLSFAKVKGQWRVFDVALGRVFENTHGELATAEELRKDPALQEYLEKIKTVEPPDILRAEKQMPIRRFRYEISRVIFHLSLNRHR